MVTQRFIFVAMFFVAWRSYRYHSARVRLAAVGHDSLSNTVSRWELQLWVLGDMRIITREYTFEYCLSVPFSIECTALTSFLLTS
jgi:hypothetical protein